MRARTKVRKDAAPALDPALAFEGIGARTLPPVLTVEAVVKGLMPPLGVSALPPSLEQDVPPSFRYWKAASLEEARDVRDELVEQRVIAAADVLKVDGVLRRVVWEAFLAKVDGEEPLVARTSLEVAGALCVVPASDQPVAVVMKGELDGDPDKTPLTAESVASAISKLGPSTVIAVVDSPEHRTALAGLASVFKLATRPDVLFGSPLALIEDAPHVERVAAPTTKSHNVRLVRKDTAEPSIEERFVFGIVLEPDVVDSQLDTYSAEEVRKTAHRFMEHHAQLGKQHTEIVTGKLKVLESYIAPVDFTIGTEVVKAGTWLLAIRVVDDDLWELTKSGGFTGFSIGGSAIRQPA